MAKKQNTAYLCDNCGETTLSWMGKCPSCNNWNTLKLYTEPGSSTKTNKNISLPNNQISKLTKIKDIEVDSDNRYRIHTGIKELDNVLGGGLVKGSVILIGGEPGIGKSTLLLQVAKNISKENKVYYFTGEESPQQIKLRADRIGSNDGQFLVSTEINVENIVEAISSDVPCLAIVDSIQTTYHPNTTSLAGSPAQIKNSSMILMQAAKLNQVALFIVGHITKEGAIAGPKLLEHIVDCVLYFEGDGKGMYRILRSVKNRYGTVDELGIFEMSESGLLEVNDASIVFANTKNSTVFAGSVIVPVMEGTRVFCVEQEALVSSTSFGYPRRLSMGYDSNRLLMIIAILEKRARIALSNQDIHINIAHGLSVKETASDLGVAMAIVSSLTGIAIQKDTTYIGELGLSGEIRRVRFIERRIKEMMKFGVKNFIIPKPCLKELNITSKDINIIGVNHIKECTDLLTNKK